MEKHKKEVEAMIDEMDEMLQTRGVDAYEVLHLLEKAKIVMEKVIGKQPEVNLELLNELSVEEDEGNITYTSNSEKQETENIEVKKEKDLVIEISQEREVNGEDSKGYDDVNMTEEAVLNRLDYEEVVLTEEGKVSEPIDEVGLEDIEGISEEEEENKGYEGTMREEEKTENDKNKSFLTRIKEYLLG